MYCNHYDPDLKTCRDDARFLAFKEARLFCFWCGLKALYLSRLEGFDFEHELQGSVSCSEFV